MASRVTLSVPNPADSGQDINLGTAAAPLVISGGGGSASSPGIAGGEFNSSPPTLTNGQTDALQLDANGKLLTQAGVGTVALADGINNSSTFLIGVTNTNSVAIASVRTFPTQFNGTTWDRDRKPSQTSRIVSAAATTNPTVAKASAGDLFRVTGFNANAAARYLKIYNKATAPTVGTDTPVWTEYLPAQARFELSFPKGYYLSAGISYALTTGVADADTGALTAADILGLNLAYA